MRKGLYLLAAAAVLAGADAFAQDAIPANEAMELLSYTRDAVQEGMAGAGSASTSATSAFASLSNPAVLPLAVKKLSAGLSYGRWAPASVNTRSNNFGMGVSLGLGKRVGINVAAVYQARPSRDFGGSYGTYAPSDILVAAGAGVAFNSWLSAGVSVKFAQQAILPDYKVSATAFTAMLQMHKGGLDVAAGVANVGGGVKSESGSVSPLPASARLAVDYSSNLGPVNLGAAVDGDYWFSGKFGVSAGLRAEFLKFFSLRAGYHYASQGAVVPSHFSAGAGIRYFGIGLDFAYVGGNPLIGNSILAQLTYKF